MGSIGEMTFNAMIYIFFVAFSGAMGVVFAGLTGYKLFMRSKQKEAVKTKKRTVKGAI